MSPRVHDGTGVGTRTHGLMADVTRRIRDAGFEVDERLWGTAADCNGAPNPPTCCGDGPCC
ncbi:hypothetical protein V1460_36110 [Streptomyces sp. SCSIO 30461]|uniref:hypothetical protein n=1 Tax=Streptomyces sp. SCSIO 30461 TaxID=3118085 RepID=UPI0030CD1D59